MADQQLHNATKSRADPLRVTSHRHRLPRAPAATRVTSIVVILIDFKPQQGCPKLIGGGSQQALGLDAGLDGGVEPDEVQGDVADQREVVGHMARAGTGIVVAELNVQAPVKPVFHFPMASHGVHEFLGIGGNAADVVTPLDAGLLIDGAGTLEI